MTSSETIAEHFKCIYRRRQSRDGDPHFTFEDFCAKKSDKVVFVDDAHLTYHDDEFWSGFVKSLLRDAFLGMRFVLFASCENYEPDPIPTEYIFGMKVSNKKPDLENIVALLRSVDLTEHFRFTFRGFPTSDYINNCQLPETTKRAMVDMLNRVATVKVPCRRMLTKKRCTG